MSFRCRPPGGSAWNDQSCDYRAFFFWVGTRLVYCFLTLCFSARTSSIVIMATLVFGASTLRPQFAMDPFLIGEYGDAIERLFASLCLHCFFG